MAMERSLLRLIMRMCAQAHVSGGASVGGALLQRGAALSMREYAAPAFTPASDGFSYTELRESNLVGGIKKRPVWQEWSCRGYANSSVEKDDGPQGNKELLDFNSHKTTTTVATKRYAVGRTAITDDDEGSLQGEQVDQEIKKKAKEILQQVGEKLGETVEEAKIRQLQEKLAATEGIGDVVHELYNRQEDHTTDYAQTARA